MLSDIPHVPPPLESDDLKLHKSKNSGFPDNVGHWVAGVKHDSIDYICGKFSIELYYYLVFL